MYKPREAAELIGFHYETILDWIRDGTLPALETPAGQYRILEHDLDKALLPTRTSQPTRRKPRGKVEVSPWVRPTVAPGRQTPRHTGGTAQTRWKRCVGFGGLAVTREPTLPWGNTNGA